MQRQPINQTDGIKTVYNYTEHDLLRRNYLLNKLSELKQEYLAIAEPIYAELIKIDQHTSRQIYIDSSQVHNGKETDKVLEPFIGEVE